MGIIQGCGAVDCVNACDGGHPYGECPNVQHRLAREEETAAAGREALWRLLDGWLDAAVAQEFSHAGWVGKVARYMADGIAADHPELLPVLAKAEGRS